MLKTVYTTNDFVIDKYTPTVLKPFYVDMEPTTLLRRIRFLIDLKYGYSVYYLKKNDKLLAYCTITSGKNPRFWFAGDKDIIIGPYYTAPEARGKGYATKLVDAVINHCETDWEKGYVSIKNSNTSSIKVTERLGGKFLFYVHNTKTKKLIKDKNGEYGIYEIVR